MEKSISSRVMEPTIQKNGTSLKSHSYRGNIRKWLYVAGIVALSLGTFSCKSLDPATLRPQGRIDKLLPPLTPEFNYESFYSRFPITTTTGSTSMYVGSSGFGTGTISAATSKNPILESFNIIFQRDVNGNISSDADEKTNGTIRCNLIEAYGKIKIWWIIPSSLTLAVGNLLGMPFWTEKHSLQIEVSIYDRNNNRIGRYTSDLQEDKASAALYYGYSEVSQKCNRVIFTKCMEDIKRQIAKDYDRLNAALQ